MAEQKFSRALITGASSGIGACLAEQLAAAGADLVIVARTRDRLESLAESLVADHDITVEVLVADLSDPTELATVEERLVRLDDPVDLLVNNAGFGFNGTFGEVDIDDETREVAVNITALVRLSHVAANTLRVLGHGGILNVASTAAFQPGPGSANYSATKAYVLSFSQALHEELRGVGVHVSTLCPGLTRTEFQDRGNYDTSKLPSFLWQEADEVAAAGLAGVSANRATVVPGIHNQVTATLGRKAPMGLVRRAAALATKTMR